MSIKTTAKLNVFVPITKVDAVKGIVYGTLAAEEKDHSGEIFDYTGSKPYFEKWSAGISKATDGKSLGNVRAMHGNVAAGKFTSMNFNDDEKRIEVAAKIVDKGELEKVLEGVYTGFSIGGKYVSRKKDGDVFRYVADPYEGSLVDLPCIPSATFEVVKADGATLQKKFNPAGEIEAKARELAKAAGSKDEELDADWPNFEAEAIEALAKVAPAAPEVPAEPTNDEVAAKAKELAKAAGSEAKWLDHIEPARAALKAAPVKPAPAHGATSSDDGTEAQVWVHKRLPGKQFGTKAEMRQALIDFDAAEKAGGLAADVTAALTDVQKALAGREAGPLTKAAFLDFATKANKDEDEAMRKASGISPEDWAAAGAFALEQPGHAAVKALAKTAGIDVGPDGEFKGMGDDTKAALVALAKVAKAEPEEIEVVEEIDLSKIADKAALAAALKDVDPEEPLGFVQRRQIVRLARKLEAVDVLPEAWGIEAVAVVDVKKIKAGDLSKAASLYGVGSLIQLLAQMDSCEESLESPSYGYGTMVPKALCDRFGAALVEFGDIVAEVLDVILAEMKTEEMGEATGNVMRAAGLIADLSKLVADQPLQKVGARHSRLDQQRINDAHDLLVDCGADCEGDDVADKTVVADLKKTMAANESAFSKTLGDVATLVKDIAARVKNIEAQPLPEGTSSYRVVEKGQEVPLLGTDEPSREEARANADIFADMSSLLVRAAHASPHREIPGYMRPRPYR